MTTATPITSATTATHLAPPQMINYTVTFHWAASSWEGMELEDNDIDYEGQPHNDSAPVVVALPDGSTPWNVYNAADYLAELPPIDNGVYGWDPRGMTITFGDRSHFLSGCLISPDTTWAQFR